MLHPFRFVAVLIALAVSVHVAVGQESNAAKATREKLKQVIGEINAKEVGTKDFFDDLNRELDKPVKFKIDNSTGVSNNSKLSYKGKKVTVEKILNELSDKYDFGWFVISNVANNREDGAIMIRKSSKGKERGYEAGKEPKKSSLELPRRDYASTSPLLLPEPVIEEVAMLPSKASRRK